MNYVFSSVCVIMAAILAYHGMSAWIWAWFLLVGFLPLQ